MGIVALVKKADPFRNAELKDLSLETLEFRLGDTIQEKDSFRSSNHWAVAMIQVCLELGIKKMNSDDIEDCLEDINNDFAGDFFEFATSNESQG